MPRQMSEYDREALGDAIVRRLSELYKEEKYRAHINARSRSRASPSAAFLATDADIPKLNKDPVKNIRPSSASAARLATPNQPVSTTRPRRVQLRSAELRSARLSIANTTAHQPP